jgi:hypothetical protein
MTTDPLSRNKPRRLSDRMGFGKYKDETVRWVIAHDIEYLGWVLENVSWFSLDSEAYGEYENYADDDAFGDLA